MEKTGYTVTIGIVEDEIIESEAMSCYIDRNFPDASVVWRGKDGAEALMLMEKHMPDILIVDIEMPVMNGLELCEQLCRQQYHGVILINTAYAEFTYAKKMISLKAFDYIVKPVNNEELFDALSRCITESKRRMNERHHHRSIEDTIKGVRQYATALLTKTLSEDVDEQLFFRALGWPSVDTLQTYVIHIMSKTPYAADHLSAFEEIKQSLSGYSVLTDYVDERHLIIIVQPKERLLLSQLRTLIWCFTACCLQIALNACATVSALCEDRVSVTREYKKYPLMPESLPETIPFRITMAGRLWGVLRRGDTDKYRSRFKRYFNGGQFEQIKKVITEILTRYDVNTIEAAWETVQLVLDAALCVWADAPLGQSISKLFQQEKTPTSWLYGFVEVCATLPLPEEWNVIDNAIQIMRVSFSQNITQTGVAEQLGLNTTYFSRLFKKRTERNFSDVLMDIRMQHAEQMLLENPNYSLEELCRSCGLSSKTYFSEVFKKWKGMTITQFLMSRTK